MKQIKSQRTDLENTTLITMIKHDLNITFSSSMFNDQRALSIVHPLGPTIDSVTLVYSCPSEEAGRRALIGTSCETEAQSGLSRVLWGSGLTTEQERGKVLAGVKPRKVTDILMGRRGVLDDI